MKIIPLKALFYMCLILKIINIPYFEYNFIENNIHSVQIVENILSKKEINSIKEIEIELESKIESNFSERKKIESFDYKQEITSDSLRIYLKNIFPNRKRGIEADYEKVITDLMELPIYPTDDNLMIDTFYKLDRLIDDYYHSLLSFEQDTEYFSKGGLSDVQAVRKMAQMKADSRFP